MLESTTTQLPPAALLRDLASVIENGIPLWRVLETNPNGDQVLMTELNKVSARWAGNDSARDLVQQLKAAANNIRAFNEVTRQKAQELIDGWVVTEPRLAPLKTLPARPDTKQTDRTAEERAVLHDLAGIFATGLTFDSLLPTGPDSQRQLINQLTSRSRRWAQNEIAARTVDQFLEALEEAKGLRQIDPPITLPFLAWMASVEPELANAVSSIYPEPSARAFSLFPGVNPVASPAAGTLIALRAALDSHLPYLAGGLYDPKAPAMLLLTVGLRIAGERGVTTDGEVDSAVRWFAGMQTPIRREALTRFWDKADKAQLKTIGDRLNKHAARTRFAVPNPERTLEQDLADLGEGLIGLTNIDEIIGRATALSLRQWMSWLRGFEASSIRWILTEHLRRAGTVHAEGSRLRVYLEPKPLDLVLRRAGFLAPLETIPWLEHMVVTFEESHPCA